MNRIRFFRYFLYLVLLSLSPIALAEDEYGYTEFDVTGTEEAKAEFSKGLLQLHNFEFYDARKTFRRTRELDPNLAMAWWGEALTHWYPLWPSTDIESSRKVLNEMGPDPESRIAMGKTERERDYLQTIEILFGEGDMPTRRHGYSDALKTLSEKYPDDLDAAAFYALSILAKSKGRNYHYYMQAAAITEEILDKNPLHPGALHYNIHSYDDTIHAPLGLRAARNYYKVAPSAVHALHMGAHIYYATGNWELGLERNIDSYEESVSRMPDPAARYHGETFHSLSWIPYGFQQQGNREKALEYIAIIADQADRHAHHPMGRMHLIETRASYILDTQEWETDLLDIEVSYEGLGEYYVATDYYIRGLVALKGEDLELAESYLKKIGTPELPESGPRNYMGPALLKMALEGKLAIAKGEIDQGLEILIEATEIDLDWPAEAGPVKPVQPMAELLAQTYQQLGDTENARKYYQLTELYSVGRLQTLKGLEMLAN